jgi:hypothetical protein
MELKPNQASTILEIANVGKVSVSVAAYDNEGPA